MEDIFGSPDTPGTGPSVDFQFEEVEAQPESGIELELEAELEEGDDVELDGEGDADGDDGDVEDGDADDAADADNADPADADDAESDIAKLYTDAQSQIGRQSGEIGELRKLVATQQEQMRELIEHLSAGPAPEVDTDSLAANAATNPVAAYNQAMQLLDGGSVTPDAVEDVIDVVMEMDPQLGRRMTQDFTRRVLLAEMEQRQAETTKQVIEPLQERDYQAQLNTASHSFYNDPTLGEDAKEFAAEIVAMFPPDPKTGLRPKLGSNAREIRAKLESALTVARGNEPHRSAAFKKAAAALKVDGQVEGGTGTKAPKKSKDEAFVERLMKPPVDRADALFA